MSRPLIPLLGAAALVLLLVAGLHALPLLSVAANRLVVGIPAHGSEAIGPAVHLVAILGAAGFLCLGTTGRRIAGPAALAASCLALAILAVALGEGARDLVAGKPAATRAGLGAGAWTAGLVLVAGIAWARRRMAVPGLGLLVAVAACGGAILAGRAALFDHLSLAVEFQARRDTIGRAVVEHLLLSCGALALAIAVTLALAPWRRARGLVDLAVGGIQVVPAVALLGGVVALASALLKAVPALREAGLSALGPGPALVGIAAYLLLPLWRGLDAGLRGTDAAILDAAEAIGLGRTQRLVQVRLPLGAPVLIGALRVAAVQSLGLATLGALVGAGGLGRIVFDGMAQFASDLILLGALPIIALSLLAEVALSAAEAGARRRWPA